MSKKRAEILNENEEKVVVNEESFVEHIVENIPGGVPMETGSIEDVSDFSDEITEVPVEEEVVVEEKKEDEIEVNKEEVKNENDLDLSAPIVYEDELMKKIEGGREEFFTMYKKQNMLKWGSAILSIGLIAVAWLYTANIPDFGLYLSLGLTAVAIGILAAYHFVTRNFQTKRLKEYFNSYYENTNNFVLQGDLYSDMSFNIEDKIDVDQFNASELYKNIAQVGSRNLVYFTHNDLRCSIVDCAGQIASTKRLVPVFVGKYLTAPCKYESDDRIMIYLYGNNRSLPPTNLDGIKKVFDNKKIVIFSNNEKWSKLVTNKVRNALNHFVLNNVLIDVAISVKKEKLHVCLGYDDNLMVLPMNDKFNPTPTKKLRDDLKVCMELIDAVN